MEKSKEPGYIPPALDDEFIEELVEEPPSRGGEGEVRKDQEKEKTKREKDSFDAGIFS